MQIRGDDVARFWSKVQKGDGCWIWTAAVNTYGYGMISIKLRPRLAHRYSYELVNGPIPPGLLACHTCDNHRCVRPDHIFLGSHADNSADMVRKGRSPKGDASGPRVHRERMRRGVDHSNAKLTEDQVREIRRGAAQGVPQTTLAARYGVGQMTISNILTGKTWTHVT